MQSLGAKTALLLQLSHYHIITLSHYHIKTLLLRLFPNTVSAYGCDQLIVEAPQ